MIRSAPRTSSLSFGVKVAMGGLFVVLLLSIAVNVFFVVHTQRANRRVRALTDELAMVRQSPAPVPAPAPSPVPDASPSPVAAPSPSDDGTPVPSPTPVPVPSPSLPSPPPPPPPSSSLSGACVNVSTTDPTTLAYLENAVIDRNGCQLANDDGSPWLPITTLAAFNATGETFATRLVPIHPAGFWDLDDTMSVLVNVTFSGPPHARKMCLDAFNFTLTSTQRALTASTIGAVPDQYWPSSANFVTAYYGSGSLFVHMYRDGSFRVAGPRGGHLAPNDYVAPAICIIYKSGHSTPAPPPNFALSNCSSRTDTPLESNRETALGQLGDYDDAVFANGTLHVLATETCSPASFEVNNPGLTGNHTALMTYHRFHSNGSRALPQAEPRVINAQQIPTSESTLAHAKLHREFARHVATQRDPGLCRLADGRLVALFEDTLGTHVSNGQVAAYRSVDQGVSWLLKDDLLYTIGAPSNHPVHPLDYRTTFATLPAGTTLPLDAEPAVLVNGSTIAPGTTLTFAVTIKQPVIGTSPNPRSGGKTRCYTGGDDVIWATGLAHRPGVTTTANRQLWTAYSRDGGWSWNLVSHLTPLAQFATEFHDVTGATGIDAPGTGHVFWQMTKPVAGIAESSTFGASLPPELNTYHVPVGALSGSVRATTRMHLPVLSSTGGYGSVATSPVDGTAYIVGATVYNANSGTSRCAADGACAAFNGHIFFTKCAPPPNVSCSLGVVIARTDFVNPLLNAQATRMVSTMPSVAVDNNGTVYVLYPDLVRQGPTYTVPGVHPGPIRRQGVILYLIRSTDQGATWSAPRQINDNVHEPWLYSSDSARFRQLLRYDSVTHSLAAVWTDTRDDTSGNATATRRYAAVVPL